MRTEKTLAESQQVIRSAIDGGINTFDSSESYGTEELLGSVLKGVQRDNIVIYTKGHGGVDDRDMNQVEIETALDKSLRNL
jgi:aryl-alcohol dehydrogenase-like predicted oxidoreductase